MGKKRRKQVEAHVPGETLTPTPDIHGPAILEAIRAGAKKMSKEQLAEEIVNLNRSARDRENLLRAILAKVPRRVAKVSDDDIDLAWRRGIQRNPHPDGNGQIYTLTTEQDENGRHERIE
jgi:hypothetical protein